MKVFRIEFLKISFALVLMIFSGLSSCSQNTNDTPSQNVSSEAITDIPFSPMAYDWPHSNSDIQPDPRVNFGRLPNGMRYAILPVPDDAGIQKPLLYMICKN